MRSRFASGFVVSCYCGSSQYQVEIRSFVLVEMPQGRRDKKDQSLPFWVGSIDRNAPQGSSTTIIRLCLVIGDPILTYPRSDLSIVVKICMMTLYTLRLHRGLGLRVDLLQVLFTGFAAQSRYR